MFKHTIFADREPTGRRKAKARGGESRHISQLVGADQARAQQYIQFALLAIIQQQGKPVLIPLDQADAIFDTHRLKLEVVDSNIILDVEEQGANIIKPSDVIQ